MKHASNGNGIVLVRQYHDAYISRQRVNVCITYNSRNNSTKDVHDNHQTDDSLEHSDELFPDSSDFYSRISIQVMMKKAILMILSTL